jgi:hypothetical protein
MSAGQEVLRLQIQQELLIERRVQAFDQQWSLDWAGRDAALLSINGRVLAINGRTRVSVLAEQAALLQARDHNRQLAQQGYDADLRDCGQCWQRDRAQLEQDIRCVQRCRVLAAQQYQAMLA